MPWIIRPPTPFEDFYGVQIRSSHDLLDHPPVHVGQPEVAPRVAVRQPLVVRDALDRFIAWRKSSCRRCCSGVSRPLAMLRTCAPAAGVLALPMAVPW